MVSEPDRDDLIARCRALSPREKRVLSAMGRHLRPKEIALQFNLSFRTVRGYADEARKKLGVASLRRAVIVFAEFEAQEGPPQSQGWQSVGVSDTPGDEATSGGGFSILPNAEPLVIEAAEVEKRSTREAPSSAVQPPDDLVEPMGPPMVAIGGRPLDSNQPVLTMSRILGLELWLSRLGFARWLGLTIVMTLLVIFGFGLAAVSLLGVFEVLQQIGGRHG